MFPDINRSLQRLALEEGGRRLVTFLRDGEDDAVALTRDELLRSARAVGAAIARRGLRGERVLITLPPGLDYLSAILGCFQAGAVAVPVTPAMRSSEWPRIGAIAADCRPRLAIHDAARGSGHPELEGLEWADFARLSEEGARHGAGFESVGPASSDLAFLQYTSGSTGTPKGVMISHGNLAHNSWLIAEARNHRAYHCLTWLPPYHDMGLIGGLLHACFSGYPHTFFSPLHFLQRPSRWLRAISRHRATVSAGPDFAFRFCAERVPEEECEGLDLSSWEIIFCGAEPVRKRTLDAFAARFAPFGFRREAFLPCYGLAESTLMVTARPWGTSAREVSRDGAQLVSSGRPMGDLEVRVMDPVSSQPLREGEIGEVQVRGPSVARGYWGREREPEGPFGEDGFLKTGDLGFIDTGELVIAGRAKSLIVIRGKNLHAEDVELTVGESHELLSPGACAALSLESGSAESLGILIEVDPRKAAQAYEAILDQARAAVIRRHGVTPSLIRLVRRGALPRTTSGKIRRFACLEALHSGALAPLAEKRGESE